MFNADIPDEDIMGAIQKLEEKYQAEEFSFQLFRSAGGFQFLTKPAYQTSIGIMLKQQSKKRLSTSAMETLSIIAYKQPISKTEIENIRGVNCDYAVQKLLDKGLIEITGKAETIGRPMLYGTTIKFMEYFGINELGELPVPKEFSDVNTIGENQDSVVELFEADNEAHSLESNADPVISSLGENTESEVLNSGSTDQGQNSVLLNSQQEDLTLHHKEQTSSVEKSPDNQEAEQGEQENIEPKKETNDQDGQT
jgi:segregation and condensation protein B